MEERVVKAAGELKSIGQKIRLTLAAATASRPALEAAKAELASSLDELVVCESSVQQLEQELVKFNDEVHSSPQKNAVDEGLKIQLDLITDNLSAQKSLLTTMRIQTTQGNDLVQELLKYWDGMEAFPELREVIYTRAIHKRLPGIAQKISEPERPRTKPEPKKQLKAGDTKKTTPPVPSERKSPEAPTNPQPLTLTSASTDLGGISGVEAPTQSATVPRPSEPKVAYTPVVSAYLGWSVDWIGDTFQITEEPVFQSPVHQAQIPGGVHLVEIGEVGLLDKTIGEQTLAKLKPNTAYVVKYYVRGFEKIQKAKLTTGSMFQITSGLHLVAHPTRLPQKMNGSNLGFRIYCNKKSSLNSAWAAFEKDGIYLIGVGSVGQWTPVETWELASELLKEVCDRNITTKPRPWMLIDMSKPVPLAYSFEPPKL